MFKSISSFTCVHCTTHVVLGNWTMRMTPMRPSERGCRVLTAASSSSTDLQSRKKKPLPAYHTNVLLNTLFGSSAKCFRTLSSIFPCKKSIFKIAKKNEVPWSFVWIKISCWWHCISIFPGYVSSSSKGLGAKKWFETSSFQAMHSVVWDWL